jgi:hypothetical protein
MNPEELDLEGLKALAFETARVDPGEDIGSAEVVLALIKRIEVEQEALILACAHDGTRIDLWRESARRSLGLVGPR